MMHERGKSDPAVVAGKPTNKADRSAAEPVEPRAGTEGNAGQQSTHRAQNRISVSQALERIRQAARQRKKERFTTLFHHLSRELLETEEERLCGRGRPDVADLRGRPGAQARSRAGGSTSPSRTDGSARWRSPPWRTRSSNGRRPRC